VSAECISAGKGGEGTTSGDSLIMIGRNFSKRTSKREASSAHSRWEESVYRRVLYGGKLRKADVTGSA